MKKIYLKDKKKIAVFSKKATSLFWDTHWKTDNLKRRIENCTDDHVFIPLVKKNLSKGSRILEGGCGQALLVHALNYQGYNTTGIDFAKETVREVNTVLPSIDVRYGDVESLPFTDNYFHGYISVGVIEHFWNGYNKVFKEMSRVIKDGGLLFISFPYMSPLRKVKSVLNLYRKSVFEKQKKNENNFYQYMLDKNIVIRDLKEIGFSVREIITYDGIKGFKDEVQLFNKQLQLMYDGIKYCKYRNKLDKLLKPFTSHMCLFVCEKN